MMNKEISYEESKAKKKDELIKKCTDAGCGRKELRFVLNKERNNLMLKPKATAVIDGYTFNLRYSNRFDSPFEDDQDVDDSALNLLTIGIDDGSIIVRRAERCLAMYLYLHPQHGEDGLFLLEDKKKEEGKNISEMELQSTVLEKIRTGQIDELQAAYYNLTGCDPFGKLSTTLQSDLYLKTQSNLHDVSEAFNDERSKFRYKLFNACKQGYIEYNTDKTMLSWKGGNMIVNVQPGDNVEDAFVNKCLGKEGDKLLELLNTKLNK